MEVSMSIWLPENLDAARKAADGKTILRIHDCGVTVVALGKRYDNLTSRPTRVFPNVAITISHLESASVRNKKGA
jgi:hypothetical protein